MDSQDNSMKERLSDNKTRRNCFRVWTIVGAILLFIAFGYVLNVLSIPVGIIIWSTILVFILRSPVNSLEKRGVKRVWGTAIAYFAMLVLLIGIIALMFSPMFGIGEQFRNLMDSVPYYVQQITDIYNKAYSDYSQFFQNETVKNWLTEATNALTGWASEVAKNSAEGVVMIGSTVASSFVVIGFSFVVAYWMLMELPALGRECRRLIGKKREEDAKMLYVTFTRVMGGYIKATLVQCILIGIACGIAYAIVGIPNSAALGAIAGLLNIIPVVGPWLGGILAALVGVFVSPWVALIAVVVTIAIQQIIYTFVSPKLMADSVDVHPALVIIALMAGSAIGGAMSGVMGSLVGMLASIPAVAAMKAIFVYYFEKKTGRILVADDGVFFKGSPPGSSSNKVDPIADAASPVRRVKIRARKIEEQVLHPGKAKKAQKDKEPDGKTASEKAVDDGSDAKKPTEENSQD